MPEINLGRVKGDPGLDGKDATINGENTLTIQAGEGVTITQEGGALIVSAGEVYSTEETRIGTWIDGKPLYRKVFSVKANDSSVWVANISELNVDTVTNMFGIINGTDNGKKVAIYCNQYLNIAGSYFNSVALWIDDNNIGLNCTHPGHQNQPANIVLEYTKTTD